MSISDMVCKVFIEKMVVGFQDVSSSAAATTKLEQDDQGKRRFDKLLFWSGLHIW